MSIKASRYRTKSSSKCRKGTGLLMLVVVVLVVILAAFQALLQGEVSSRRNVLQRDQADTMKRALQLAQSTSTDWATPITFPVDQTTGEKIVVTADKEQQNIIATWVVNDQEIRSLTRPIDRKDAESKPENQK